MESSISPSAAQNSVFLARKMFMFFVVFLFKKKMSLKQ